MTSGYYRCPTIYQDTVVFVCEDDLWTVPAQGGIARRLTSNLGEVSYPFLSPDGSQIAFVGREDGQQEIYVMPAMGGPARRLTYMAGSIVQTAGWTADGKIIFANNARQPFDRLLYLYTIDPGGGQIQLVNVGPARGISYGRQGLRVIARNTRDPARWKRYRGGMAGQLWVDPNGQGEFHPLINLKGNLINPMVIGERIYFLSDHDGTGNIYSCLADGSDLRRHTDHQDFYARNAASDGQRIVYHAGADLYLFDPASGEDRQIAVQFFSPQTQRERKYVDPERYLNSYDLHPRGHALAVSARSLAYTFTNWEGAVYQHGDAASGVRYRLPAWLNDGLRLLALTDEGGEEAFVILTADGSRPPERLPALDIGRPDEVAVNPHKDQIVFTNHRHELLFLDLQTHELKQIDQSRYSPVRGFDWSPDGEWVVYSSSITIRRTGLKLWKAATGEVFSLTDPVLRDEFPVFEPHGKFIYFLSYRTFEPVNDNMAFDLTFLRGVKPYLISLKKDTLSPFTPFIKFSAPPKEKESEEPAEEPGKASAQAKAEPEAENEGGTEGENPEPPAQEEGQKAEAAKPAEEKGDEEKIQPVEIDLEGIQQRILAFPVSESRYGRVMGALDGKVFYSVFPVEGIVDELEGHAEPPSRGVLMFYDFEEQKEEHFLHGLNDFRIGKDGKTMVIQAGWRLRVIKTTFKPDSDDTPGKKSGWINLDRLRVPVVPGAEWRQMLREIWRMQRDHFWTPDMSQIDWVGIYQRYLPLVDRVSSRAEFSDLVWELQGELATSHCYELGGDYRPRPMYPQGSLGADFEFDEASGGWKITHIVQGDVWNEREGSPLARLGTQVKEGDILLAINGSRLSRELSPAEALVNLAHTQVTLTFASEKEEAPIVILVKTIGDETAARYREWVDNNRKTVHERTGGKVGYIHIPDMGPGGYAEFHRGYLAEIEHEGLVVDVRFNQGGFVSELLLEKLARRRIGVAQARWFAEPFPYPQESAGGPMVALTNEFAGSDGDIFSHGFKLMGLGPLIGKRTWGGVIGLFGGHMLVDGTVTTQPEVAFWFKDVGWGVENYGTDPDIEVDIAPQDYVHGVDPQLDKAIEEVTRRLAENPPLSPDLSQRPSKAAPKLPER